MPASIQEKVYIHSKNVKSRLFGIFKNLPGYIVSRSICTLRPVTVGCTTCVQLLVETFRILFNQTRRIVY